MSLRLQLEITFSPQSAIGNTASQGSDDKRKRRLTVFGAKCILFPLGASCSQPSSLWAVEHFECLGGTFHLHLLQAATASSGRKLQRGTKNNYNWAWKRTQLKQMKMCLPLYGRLKTCCKTVVIVVNNYQFWRSWVKPMCGWNLLQPRCLGALPVCHRGSSPDKEGDSESQTQQKLRGSN